MLWAGMALVEAVVLVRGRGIDDDIDDVDDDGCLLSLIFS